MADVVYTTGRNGVRLSHQHCKNKALCGAQHCFKAAKGDRSEISATMQELSAKRREKQPLEYPSAGSTFKRPEGYFAGKLIMDAGLAGACVGGAQVSEKHCGFVINRKNATSADVAGLIQKVTETVQEKFGVTLEPEVIFLGDFEK